MGNTEKQRRFYQLNGIVIEDFFPFWRERIPQRIRRRKRNESRPLPKLYSQSTIRLILTYAVAEEISFMSFSLF